MNRYSNKMLVETLSIAQSLIADSPFNEHRKDADIERLQFLIDDLQSWDEGS